MTTSALSFPSQERQINSRLLPLLQEAMNGDAVATALAHDWSWARNRGLAVDAVELVRVYPRHRGHYVLEYAVQLSGDEGSIVQTLFGELVSDNVRKHCDATILSLRKRHRGQLPKNRTADEVLSLPQLGMVVRLPGLDERLIGLRMLHDPVFATAVMEKLSDRSEGGVSNMSVEMLGHRLGKRAILRLRFNSTGSAGHESVIAKLYKNRSQKPEQVFARMRALDRNGFGEAARVRIPKPITMSPGQQAIFMEDVAATPLEEVMSGDLFAATGDAIAKLHSTPLEVKDRFKVEDEINLLQRRVALLDEVFPAWGFLARPVLQNVIHHLLSLPLATPSLVHRDCYEKQILIGQDGVVLIDFDTLCMSDPAIDVGNFLAHIDLTRLQELNPCVDAEAQFLGGYRVDSTMLPRIQVWRQSTLLRLACLYAFWPRWHGVVRPLLELANEY